MVSSDNAFSNRQPKDGTAAAATFIGLEEPIKDAWQMFG